MCIYLTLPKNNLIHSLEEPFLKLQGCWYGQTDACHANPISSTPVTKYQPSGRVTSLQMLDFQGVIYHLYLLWKTVLQG